MATAMVPLDEQLVTERDESLPALHPRRMSQRLFLQYLPPPADPSAAELEEFMERSRFITEDLEWLLSLPHDRFWCQMVFDESLQRCLDSYLQLAPRGCDVSVSSCSSHTQGALHRAVFMTFLRTSTYKESKEHFLTAAAFKEIIYDNFLFDIPKIMDLCVLFGKGNATLLHKMIENIFQHQPSYFSDLEEAVPTVLQVFESILQRCGLQSGLSSAVEPLKLTEPRAAHVSNMDQQELCDLVVYLCDSISTIHSFLEIFPQACSSFFRLGFISRLSSFYESAVPELEAAARRGTFQDKGLQMQLCVRLSHSCRRMLDTTHLLLQHNCVQPILEGGEPQQKCAEELLQIFTSFLPEKRFLCDYNAQFPVGDDISLLQQAVPLLDETRTSYLLQGVDSVLEGAGTRRAETRGAGTRGAETRGAGTRRAEVLKKQEIQGPPELTGEPPEGPQSRAVRPQTPQLCPLSSVQVDSLLSSLQELLPDLGQGFLLSCLQEYDYDSELVIHNILEDRLSPALCVLERTLPRPPVEPLPELLQHRSNVFDDDQFDVFRRDQVDMRRVWKGRRKGESAQELLNDKRHIHDQRERYQAYETVVDLVPVSEDSGSGPGPGPDYDDDYDDTYDMGQVGANDRDQDSLLRWRPFTVPQILRQGRRAEEEEESEEEAEEESNQSSVQRENFVQDPALLRERAEARRAATQRRGFRPERQSHVVGEAKGRGQSHETNVDRRRKESNKSRGANHNRRALAGRKMNKGMVPM